MRSLATAAAALSLATPPPPGFVREPATGVTFPKSVGDMSLLGVSVQRKTIFRIKVYAIGLYVADSALSGPLAVHKGKVGTAAFYSDLVTGDFEKEIVLKLVRGLSADQIQGAFRENIGLVDRGLLSQFVSYFATAAAGQECVLHWAPGGILETQVAGVAKPAIGDRAFSEAVFAIWLGERPLDEKTRKGMVSRASELLE
jgi:hypothetical protein